MKSYKLQSPTSLGQTSVSLHSRLHVGSATLGGLPAAFTVDSPPPRVPAAPGYLTFPPAFCILIRSSYWVGLCSLLRLKAACL